MVISKKSKLTSKKIFKDFDVVNVNIAKTCGILKILTSKQQFSTVIFSPEYRATMDWPYD